MTKISYATDVIIFGISNEENNNIRELPAKNLSLLLVKRTHDPFNNTWCLPGGYIGVEETANEAAIRVLKKETNLTDVYLNSYATFDSLNRDPRGRVISNSFISLVDKEKINEQLDSNSAWFNISVTSNKEEMNIKLINESLELKIKLKKEIKYLTTSEYTYTVISSDLAFDHGLIIASALDNIKERVKNTDIVFNLLPKEFTIGELKQIYELLLDKKLINSAFRRVIASKVKPTNKIVKKGGYRPSELYTYKKPTY